MKLQHLAVIFIIIMLPITLILSQYIQTQIDLVNIRNSYTTSLLNATHDAMTAYELNSMNNDYNEDANSKKRDVQASINTFFNSLSNNLGVPGYIDKYVQPYIPAIVFTGYDGYYIYAKTTEVDRYTKEDEDSGLGEEGDIIGSSTSTAYNLKPYIYYSAQYKKGKIDVVINYTLDNYITVYGTLKDGSYISESGYLLLESETRSYTSETNLSENVICIRKTAAGNEYFSETNCRYYYTYSPLNKTMQKIYYTDTNDIGYFQITSAGYLSQVSTSNYTEIDNIGDLNSNNIKTTYILKNPQILNQLYEKNLDGFTKKIIENLKTLTINDMVVNDGNDRRTLEDVTDTNNPYYNLKSDKNIFEENLVNFNDHKQDIIKISIQENLKSALANYSSNTDTDGDGTLDVDITYKLPIFTETDWQKIFSNITMIAFMQDLPVSNGTYNNYAIATSTGNKEYIPDDGIYFIDESTNTYHRITCDEIKDKTTGLIGYKAMEFQRNNSKIDGEAQYYYPHDATACYKCIVSSDYASLYDQNGNITVTNADLLKIYYSALARERVTQYKATKYLTSY